MNRDIGLRKIKKNRGRGMILLGISIWGKGLAAKGLELKDKGKWKNMSSRGLDKGKGKLMTY